MRSRRVVSKDELFEFLLDLLAAHPDLARGTDAEAAVFAAARTNPEDPGALLDAAAIHEELGRYDVAEALAERARSSKTIDPRAGRRRFDFWSPWARYQGQWLRVEELCAEAEARDPRLRGAIEADLAVERAHRALAVGDYDRERNLLEHALVSQPLTPRTGELRFYAGVACYFLGDEERAEYHWCWVNENIPDDVLARRCYIAAARTITITITRKLLWSLSSRS